MIVLIFLSLFSTAQATQIPFLKLMLQERAYIEDIRAYVQAPLPSEYLGFGEEKPINRQRSHALEIGIEDAIMTLFTRHGQFYDSFPVLSRLAIYVDVKHSDIEARQRAGPGEHTYIVNGLLRVVFIPRGEEISGIPVRFEATTQSLGDLYGFKSIIMLDLDGKALTSIPPDGRFGLLHLFNDPIFIDALHEHDLECARLLL